jgi:hypothetical protein
MRVPQNIGDCDLAVFWGHRQVHIINAQKKKKRHYLVMERAYISDRFTWTSLGFDGLNGRAKFPQINDAGARWRKHFAQYLKPWKKDLPKLAVIMGQVRGDASLSGISIINWVSYTAGQLAGAGYKAVFRPHPGDRGQPYEIPGIKKLNSTLEEALTAAGLCVTYNSNSGVDAILAGVPTYAQDPGSMVWDVSSRNFCPITPDRAKWSERMAYTQWLPEEIESGDAWEALKTVIRG